MIVWPAKKPGEVLDYSWTVPLDEGDAIDSFVATVEDGTVSIDTESDASGKITLTLSGGIEFERAKINIAASTTGGRTFIETFSLFIGVEKLTIDTLKQWLRYEPEDGEQDLLLSIGLGAAIGWVEKQTGLLLTRREVTQPVRSFDGCVRALWGPNPELTTITYVGSDDTPATIDDGRVVITDSLGNGSFYPALGAQWPWGSEISIAYMAGYADPDDVPEGLLMAVLLLAGNWDTNRIGVTTGNSTASELPLAVQSLVEQFRIPVLA